MQRVGQKNLIIQIEQEIQTSVYYHNIWKV